MYVVCINACQCADAVMSLRLCDGGHFAFSAHAELRRCLRAWTVLKDASIFLHRRGMLEVRTPNFRMHWFQGDGQRHY